MKRLIVFIWLTFLPLFVSAQDFNCFTVIAGNKATIDGSVMMAHNEDDGGEQMLNWYCVPAMSHSQEEFYHFRNGGKISLPAETNGYLWLELPKMDVSDSYLNDKGVAIVSDGCPSKEDRKDYTDGGVVYELREMVARQAVSARHAVEIMGALVEKFGYASTGRSYCVADAKEAWVVAVVQGRHWVARRVPDDQVMVLPNAYVIDSIDLNDAQNFAGSPDIISYAMERGWYDPVRDGEFSFRRAYSDARTLENPGNVLRAWAPVCRLSGKLYGRQAADLPFSFQPAEKISLQTLMNVLSSHYDDEPLNNQRTPSHGAKFSVCHDDTRYGTVFQLRSDMPVEIGSVAWIAPANPCMQVFVPWYAGMNKAPSGYARYNEANEAIMKHFTDTKNFRENYPDKAFWKYFDFSESISKDYSNRIHQVKKRNVRFQNKLLKQQNLFEKQMITLYHKNKKQCVEKLSEYTDRWNKKVIPTE